MTKLIKELLPTILPPATSWQRHLIAHWDTVVGDLKQYVFLEKILDDTTLVLGVTNTLWMQELYYLSDVIIQKINSTLEYPHVKNIKFYYRPRKKITRVFQPPPKKNLMPTSCVLTLPQKKALERIPDEQLQEALKRFLIRCMHP